jgi:Protein of unknown function (DUF2630)
VDDRDLIDRITHLVSEEQKMQQNPDHDPAELGKLEVTLDQLWDLLRQRRSREEFGRDPSEVHSRDPKTVEGYLQ